MKYAELRKINVNEHVEKKPAGNGKTMPYLSWSWAVDQLLQADETATWEYHEPKEWYGTWMVFCSVTAFGKTMTAQLPVLDHRNQAIVEPNAMQVNTAMQRCLAKAIALHGIGLYIYAGEDLPDGEADEPLVETLRQAAKNGETSLRAKWKEIAASMNSATKDAFWGKYGKELKEIANGTTD